MTNLTKAFKELRSIGYFAKQNFMCCQSCAWALIENENAVFYHAQDLSDLKESGEVYLSWSGNGHEIVKILSKNNLKVEWNGEDSRRIKVKTN